MSWPWIVLIAWPFVSVLTGIIVGRMIALGDPDRDPQ